MNILILITALIIAMQTPITINLTIPQATETTAPQEALSEPQEALSEPQAQAESFNGYSAEDIDLIARVVQAEAGGEDETGKRLIVSVILNRMRSSLPDFVSQTTIQSVINAPNQFATASWASAECYDAVYKELQEQTDARVLWFASTGFQPYGTELYQHGGHYFNGE